MKLVEQSGKCGKITIFDHDFLLKTLQSFLHNLVMAVMVSKSLSRGGVFEPKNLMAWVSAWGRGW